MNSKDILASNDPDLAIKTNTSIIVSIEGKEVRLTAQDLIRLREQEAERSRH